MKTLVIIVIFIVSIGVYRIWQTYHEAIVYDQKLEVLNKDINLLNKKKNQMSFLMDRPMASVSEHINQVMGFLIYQARLHHFKQMMKLGLVMKDAQWVGVYRQDIEINLQLNDGNSDMAHVLSWIDIFKNQCPLQVQRLILKGNRLDMMLQVFGI